MEVLGFGCGCVHWIWVSWFLFFLHCGMQGSFVGHVVGFVGVE